MRLDSQRVIDVVIPAHEKDLLTLNHCIRAVKKKVVGVRRIIVVSKAKYTEEAEWFDESLFPFSFQEVAQIVECGTGWHYQQLLKLYSVIVIPEISENVLVVDSDTVFFREVSFFSSDGKALYNIAKDKGLEESEFHQNSFKNIVKDIPEIATRLPKEFRNISGICHHMLFQKHVIENLFRTVEQIDGTGDPFYKIFLKNSGPGYAVAEYNLYFYFLICFYPEQYQIRILNYKNTANFCLWKYRITKKYHYCSYHSYMREEEDFLSKIIKKIKRIFFVESWILGISDSSIHDFLDSNPKVQWIKDSPKLNFWADPFGFKIGEKEYIIFEDYSQIKKRGRISIARLRDNFRVCDKKIVLDDSNHLSYPFVLKVQDKICVLCESYKSNKLSLYEIDQVSLSLKKVRDIFSDRKIVDPTIIFYDDKYWLFYTKGEQCDSKLFLAYSDSLSEEFIDHPQNPVKTDISSARSAGTPFIFKGELFRPAQNCLNHYGSGITINRITKMTTEEFAEEKVRSIQPEEKCKKFSGYHTLSSFGNKTLIDGKIEIFVIYKPFISLVRNFTRLFK